MSTRASLSLFLLLLLFVREPARADESLRLFTIARSTNANIVCYDANIAPDGKLDPAEPISGYWRMDAEDGRIEALTWLEREHAYGFTATLAPDRRSVTLELQAVSTRSIRVSVEGGTAVPETEISGKAARLEKVFVQASGGLFPGADWVEISGRDGKTGEEVQERLSP